MDKQKNTYTPIANLGSNTYSQIDNPLSYCVNPDKLDSMFLHGGHTDSLLAPESEHCQRFMAGYCAKKWDGFCEFSSRNQSTTVPDYLNTCNTHSSAVFLGLNAGEILVRNTAAKKYLLDITNAEEKYELFDPTVPTSAMISYWQKKPCSKLTGVGLDYGKVEPTYAVDPTNIDNDIVMDKILSKPIIAFDLLINIYNTMKLNGDLQKLKGTKLGHFYSSVNYFKNLGGL